VRWQYGAVAGKRDRKADPAEGVRISAMQRLEPYLHLHRSWVESQEAATPENASGVAEGPIVDEEAAEETDGFDVAVGFEAGPEDADALESAEPIMLAEPAPEEPQEVEPPAPVEVVADATPLVPFVAATPAEPEHDVKEPDMTPQVDDAQGLRAELDKAPVDVAAMFDRVAARYDIVNDVLALGQTRIWRNMVVRAVNPGPGDRILDLAAGTGTSSAPFAARGAEVVPCDFSLGMLEVGKRRQPTLPFVAGDALNLPFRDNAFDAVTISFGLRNVHDTDRALQEMLRVTKPGGKIVVCEFSTPVFGPFRTVYMNYLMKALPAIARRTSSNPAAYVYLAESIREWPDQPHLAAKLQQAGWERVQWRNATGGIVAIHRGFKPAE